MDNKNKKLFKILERTSERIAKYLNNWAIKHRDILKILKKIDKHKKNGFRLRYKDKISLGGYSDYQFYMGKITGYLYILQELSGGIYRLNSKKNPEFYKWIKLTKIEWTCKEPDCPLYI